MKKSTIAIMALTGLCFVGVASTLAIADRMSHDGYQRFAKAFLGGKPLQPKNHIELLFVQSAKKATMTPALSHKKCVTLSLQDMPNGLEYFTDSPHRMAGRLTVHEFMRVWHHQSKETAFSPNVALQADVSSGKGKKQTYQQLLSLRDPRYNAKGGSLSFLACPLKGKSIDKVANLKNVTLFYDTFTEWPP